MFLCFFLLDLDPQPLPQTQMRRHLRFPLHFLHTKILSSMAFSNPLPFLTFSLLPTLPNRLPLPNLLPLLFLLPLLTLPPSLFVSLLPVQSTTNSTTPPPPL